MRVGYAAADLGVAVGAAMGGYAFREGTARGHLDPLQVTAVTWHDGRRRAALALADVICVNTDLVRAVRAAVPDVDVLWLAASHTHAGPETGCTPGGTATPQPWLDRLCTAVAETVGRAVTAEEESRGWFHSGVLHDVGAVRSRAVGQAAVPLDVIEVTGPRGTRAGVLVVLPVHPTVLPADNLLISPDLTGAVRRALAARLGPQVWVAVATGAAGDISTRHTRRGQGPPELTRLGALVADRCWALLTQRGTAAWSQQSILDWRSQTARLTPKNPPADGRALLAAAASALADARESRDPVATRIATGNLHGARLAAALPAQPGDIEAEVAAWRIGELAAAALPGEPFLELAHAVRHRRARPTVVLGYANGYPGYLPTAAAYQTADYESLATAVAPGSGEQLADIASQLIAHLDGAHQ